MANYLIIAGTNTIGQKSAKLLIAQNHKVIITGRNVLFLLTPENS